MPEPSQLNQSQNVLFPYNHTHTRSFEGINILYIDDDYVNYLYYNELLSESGIILHRVCSSDQAIHYMHSFKKFSLVMVSSAIAMNSCLEIIRNIKNTFPNMLVITILENNDPEKEQACIDAGSDISLTRFIDQINLIEVLSELIMPNTKTV
jgi:CheY-like chemotaxis protein